MHRIRPPVALGAVRQGATFWDMDSIISIHQDKGLRRQSIGLLPIEVLSLDLREIGDRPRPALAFDGPHDHGRNLSVVGAHPHRLQEI